MSRVRFHKVVLMCVLLGCVVSPRVGAHIMPVHAFRPVAVEPLPQIFANGYTPGPVVLKGAERIYLAVPSVGSAARVWEQFEDILPVVERPFQADRIWGYWLGYYQSSHPLYWGWGVYTLSRDRSSVTTVPEPSTLVVMGLGGVLLVRRKRLSVSRLS